MSWRLQPSDKLDMTDRRETIQFFKDDLEQAEKYLKFLELQQSYGRKVPPKFFAAAKRDIRDSKHNLALILEKLGA